MAQEKKTLGLQGMHCASCVSRVEKALARVPGVSHATVNLATEKATVEYDPDRCSVGDLTGAVENAGYAATDPDEHRASDAEQDARAAEVADLRRKVWVSGIAGVLILWGTFPGLMATAPDLLRNPLVQLLLATPVQLWAGWSFYR